MNFEEYSKKALSTAVYPLDSEIVYPALGLNGEAGEVAEKVKKVIRDKGGIWSDEDKIELMKEIGDCLWYLNAIANDIGMDLETAAKMNIIKLSTRKQRNKLHGSGDNR